MKTVNDLILDLLKISVENGDSEVYLEGWDDCGYECKGLYSGKIKVIGDVVLITKEYVD